MPLYHSNLKQYQCEYGSFNLGAIVGLSRQKYEKDLYTVSIDCLPD